jgi:leucine-rich repeat protein SHOC2
MLETLEVLALQYNALYKLPPSFAALTALINLSLTGNKIECFPGPQLAALKALTTLAYGENRLHQWQPGEKATVLGEDAAGNDQVLGDEDSEDVGIVPCNPLVALESIQYLDLSDNALTSLPTFGWDRLDQLLHLKLLRNRLSSLPSGLGSLPKLQRLDVAANKLKTLPQSLFSSKTLAFLDAQQNTLQELPDNAGGCEALVRLVLTRNRDLRGLPGSVCRLARLQELRVDKSCFLALDDEVAVFCRGLAFFSAE